jgi:hypothetical protein
VSQVLLAERFCARPEMGRDLVRLRAAALDCLAQVIRDGRNSGTPSIKCDDECKCSINDDQNQSVAAAEKAANHKDAGGEKSHDQKPPK